MKIRTQFSIFILGIIIIPVLVFTSLFLIRYYNRPEQLLLPGYNEISEMAETVIPQKDWRLIEKTLRHMPANVGVAVLTVDNAVVYSNIDMLKLNSHYTSEELIELIKNSSDSFYYQLETPIPPNFQNHSNNRKKETEKINKNELQNLKSELFVITRISKTGRRKPSFFISIYWVIIAVFGILTIFCSIMLSIISRSITHSITMLEKATKQITMGNLGEPVAVKGSNEITSLTESLNKMRLALKEDNLRRTRLIMGISHDLRTPIALIKGYTEALSDGTANDPEMKRKSIEIVGNKIEQLEDMVDELINFVKVDSGEWRQNLDFHAIAPFLAEFAARLETDGNLLERSVKTSVKINESIKIAYDERLLLRALENLASNAFRYTQKNGNVSFEAVSSDKKIELKISNDGTGISPNDIPFIFDPFFRGSNSRREKGTGLGLSIVKSIIDAHGWQIKVFENQENITTFLIDIPLELKNFSS